jgi:sec-independent protein translocase protein TatA
MNFLTIFLELTPMHVMLVLGIALLLFGGKKIPELMKGLGSGVKEFKKAAQQDDQPAVLKKEEETKE